MRHGACIRELLAGKSWAAGCTGLAACVQPLHVCTVSSRHSCRAVPSVAFCQHLAGLPSPQVLLTCTACASAAALSLALSVAACTFCLFFCTFFSLKNSSRSSSSSSPCVCERERGEGQSGCGGQQ